LAKSGEMRRSSARRATADGRWSIIWDAGCADVWVSIPSTREAHRRVRSRVIAVMTLGQLPDGPSIGAAAAVLILGSHGIAAAAAAGVLLTVTGTVGGLCFAAWAGGDRLWLAGRSARLKRARGRRSDYNVIETDA
jgi:hypothetical protein